MDTFGRLPNDLLNDIKYLFLLPKIDIVDNSPFHFIVKYQLVTIKLQMISRLRRNQTQRIYYDISDNLIFDKFINDLDNNVNCHYDENKYAYCEGECEENFDIDVKDGIIKINNGVSEVFLTKESKNELINAMIQYRDLLNKFVKKND